MTVYEIFATGIAFMLPIFAVFCAIAAVIREDNLTRRGYGLRRLACQERDWTAADKQRLSKKEQNIMRACNRIRRAAQHTRIINRSTTVFQVSCDVVAWSEDKVRTEHVWQAIAIPASSAIDLEPTNDGGFRIKGSQA